MSKEGKNRAVQGAIKLSIAEKRNNFVVAEAYVKSLIETDTVLKQGEHFGFTDQKKKIPTTIKIFPTPRGGIQKTQVIEMIRGIFESKDIEISSEPENPFVHVEAKNVNVPTWFTQKMKTESKVDPVNGADLKRNTPTSRIVSETFTPAHELILKAIELNNVLAFGKTWHKDWIILSLPDTVEKQWALDVFNSFGFNTEGCEAFCLKVFIKPDINPDSIVKIEGAKPTNHERFSDDLAAAIIITRWELSKPNSPVRLIGDLNDHATKSTPFKMEDSNAGRTAAQNFADFMANNYGVVIRLETKDPYIFRVLSPKDKDYAEAKVEQVERQRKGKSGHEITTFLETKGFASKGMPVSKEVPAFSTHLKDGLPNWIELTYGDEDQKIETVKAMAEALKPFLKGKKYKIKDFGKKGTHISFEKKWLRKVARKTLVIDLEKPEPTDDDIIPKLSYQTIPTIAEVARLCEVPSWSKKDKDRLSYSRGAENKETGWTSFSILGNVSDAEKAEKKQLIMKTAIALGYTKESFLDLHPDSGSFKYRNDMPNPDLDKAKARSLILELSSKTPSNVVAVDKTAAEDESFKSFGNKIIGLLVKELTEDSDLYERIGVLYPQEKVDPAETKTLVSGILEKEFTATPASFEGPAGKFYSDDEIKKFIDRVINDLPS